MQQNTSTTSKQEQPLGVRGPFGTSFTESRGRVLLVSGGTGTAPLLFLAKQLATKTERMSFVEGAKTKDELLFIRELNSVCSEKNLITTTEDGTYGLQCLVTEPLSKLLRPRKIQHDLHMWSRNYG